MSERKNIERLFQEKFKDFEATPSSQVWENISTQLEKKENKKRVIPFWFNLKAAGIAAALVVGFFTANNYTNTFKFNKSKNTENLVLTEKNKTETLQNNQNVKINNEIVESPKNENSTTNKDIEKNIISSRNNLVVIKNKNISADKNNSIVDNSNNHNSVATKAQNKDISISSNQDIKNDSHQNNFIIANQNNNNKVSSSNRNTNFGTKKPSNTILVSSESNTNNKEASNKSPYVIKKRKSNQKNNINILDSSSEIEIANNSENRSTKNKHSKQSVSNKNKSFILNQPSESLVQNNNTKNTNFRTNLEENTKEENINSLDVNSNSSIANTTNASTTLPEIITKDSIIVAVVEENPLEKILKEKETKEKEEKKIAENTQKWKVKPNVAPLFMSATQGSPIDNQFADNAKSYENTLSVGLGVDYAVSKKLSIRTGINKFDYSYNTNDIVYYADFASKNANSVSNLKTINVASDAKNMIIEDKNISKSKEIAFQAKDEGLLNQKTGYLEIPVEVSYKLLDKKFGIQVITGFSSLLLNKNEVSVISSGLTTIVGEANNLNKVHFSTNIGLGFKYSFWKSFEANFEPTFKYQLNTYNANSGGFKPYLLGLYSGISFKF
ncbi:hypothetical protein [Flavobacterium sp.]|uniref:hypothetical protein n=1 Tax=Flavobacterium sp. TaxID=239 RepID=UPI0038FD062A